MKKFTDFKPSRKVKKINEDINSLNTPEIKVKTPEVNEKTPCVKLFSKLFESREMAHIYHLQAKGESTYAAHMALGTYYEDVLEIIDEIIETYSGQYGIVEGYDVIDTTETRTKDKTQYFEELVLSIKEGRKCISQEDSHLHNLIDEVVALAYRTLYKLKYLN